MISIKKYTIKNLKIWNDFINISNNGTIFQNQTFLNYHIQRKFNNHSLIIKKNDQIVALLPAVIINNNNKITLYSHPGASYGGIVYEKNISFKLINDIIVAIDKYCKIMKFDSVLLINTPNIYFQNYNEDENYLLSFNKFIVCERYISHIVKLKKKDELLNLLSKRKQRYINNGSFKEFKFKSSTDFKSFYTILLNSKKLYKTKPTHSLQELKKIKKLFPSKCELLLSYHKNQLVGGAFLIIVNKKVCLVFYNVINENYRGTQLSSFQLYHCMIKAVKFGCGVIDFGVSQTPKGENPLAPKLSLIKFKEQFGAKGIIRTVYKKNYDYD